MWLLLWLNIPLALGHPRHLDDSFLAQARQEIDFFHRTLFLTDSLPEASHAWRKSTKTNKQSREKGKRNESGLGRNTLTSKKSKSHEVEGRKAGKSDKEKLINQYEESQGKKKESLLGDDKSEEFHKSVRNEQGRKFEDKLLHKKGNYEKGYRDKYHLDEVVKQNKFWSDDHSLDQYHKFGKNGEEFLHKQDKKSKKGDTQSKEEKKENGKKGQSAEGHNKSEHAGHTENHGKEMKYERNQDYEKRKIDNKLIQ